MTAKHEPTDEQRKTVAAMTAYGVPQPDLAAVIGIDPKTLRLHYSRELATAQSEANAKVAQSLFKKALGDGPQSVTAAIFWLKTRAQWRDVTQVEHSGPDGGPIQTEDTGARDRLAAIIARLAPAGNTSGGAGEAD